jgi:hypothetical protein
VASRTASWMMAPRRTASSAFPTSFVAPNGHDRPAFSRMDNRRDENSSSCRMGKGGLIVVGGCGDLVEPNRRRRHQPDPLAGRVVRGRLFLGRSVQISSGVDATQDSCQARPDSAPGGTSSCLLRHRQSQKQHRSDQRHHRTRPLTCRRLRQPTQLPATDDPGCRTAHPPPKSPVSRITTHPTSSPSCTVSDRSVTILQA